MTAAALIEELTQLGVTLTVDGDLLRYRAPRSMITPELKELLAERKAEIIAALTAGEYGRGRPSLENASRPIEERCAEALELLGELTEFCNERASILEFKGHFPRAEAERLALIETKATETYRRWLALG